MYELNDLIFAVLYVVSSIRGQQLSAKSQQYKKEDIHGDQD